MSVRRFSQRQPMNIKLYSIWVLGQYLGLNAHTLFLRFAQPKTDIQEERSEINALKRFNHFSIRFFSLYFSVYVLFFDKQWHMNSVTSSDRCWRARIVTNEWIDWWIKWEKDPESRALVFKLVEKRQFLTNLCKFQNFSSKNSNILIIIWRMSCLRIDNDEPMEKK